MGPNGQMTITCEGFGLQNARKNFSPNQHGYADAVAQAIEWLAKDVLPHATAADHKLHENEQSPPGTFERSGIKQAA